MLSSVLVAYFLHQFHTPVIPTYRTDQSAQHIRTVQQRGRLTVETSSAVVGSVPPGASRVEMLRLRVSADCTGDVPIRSINVQRRGLGANADIEALYVVHRGRRVSTARSVTQRNGNVDLNVRNLLIPACLQEDVLVLADFSQEASPAGEHTIKLKGIDAGKTTVRINDRAGDFTRPFRTTGGRVIGKLTADYLKLNRRVRYGSRQMLLRFTLSADNNGDQLVKGISFTNNGSASNEDLQNLYMSFRNRRISTIAASMDDDMVHLFLDPPVRINKGNTLKFALRGDVRASRSRTIQFIIEEEGDIEAEWKTGR